LDAFNKHYSLTSSSADRLEAAYWYVRGFLSFAKVISHAEKDS